MATKKGGGGGPAPSGSPIIVDGGGSIKIKFPHKDYDQPGGGDEHHHKNNNQANSPEIDRIEITGYPDTVIPAGKKATVTISLRE